MKKNWSEKKVKLKLQEASLVIVLASLFWVFPAWAKTPVSLTVSPLSYDLAINPGEEKKAVVSVGNNSDQPIEVKVEFSDFFVGEDGSYVFPSEEDKAAIEKYKLFFMKNWFQTDKESFVLPKGGSENVEIRVKVPEKATLGGHYGAVFFRTNCQLEEDTAVVSSDKSKVCVSARPGVLFLIQVGGEAVKSGELKKMEIPKISFADKENLEIEIQNTGNTHFKPEGTILAKNLAGRVVFQMDIKDRTLLPGLSRSFSGALERKDWAGIYRVSGLVKDGNGKEMKFQKWTFLVPWKEWLAIFGLLSLGIWFWRNFKVKKKKAK